MTFEKFFRFKIAKVESTIERTDAILLTPVNSASSPNPAPLLKNTSLLLTSITDSPSRLENVPSFSRLVM